MSRVERHKDEYSKEDRLAIENRTARGAEGSGSAAPAGRAVRSDSAASAPAAAGGRAARNQEAAATAPATAGGRAARNQEAAVPEIGGWD